MKTIYTSVLATAFLAGSLLLTSCDDEKIYDMNHSEAPFVNEITFNYGGTLLLPVGEALDLNVKIDPDTLGVEDLSFKSDNPSVANIDKGVLYCSNLGTATVTAFPLVGFGPSASLKIQVIDHVNYSATVEVTPVTTLPEYVIEGDEIQLKATSTGADENEAPTYAYYTWTSSNPEVAEVDETGLVSCLTPGEVTITATTRKPDVEGVSGAFTMTVMEGVEVENVTIAPVQSAYYFEEPILLDVTYEPVYGNRKEVIWTSDNESVVTVENGVVKTVGFGTAEITATCPNGNASSVTVYVVPGWHVWDEQNSFSGWVPATAGSTFDLENPSYLTVNMGISGTNYRADIKYNCSSNKPLVMNFGESPVVALRTTIPADGRNTFDITDVNGEGGGNPQCNIGRFATGNPLILADGSNVIYVDFSNNKHFSHTENTMFKSFQIKVADIPMATTSETSYRIYWIRTFASVAEMEAFAQAQVEAGE